MDIVREMLDAYNAHDVERFVACFTPDAKIETGDGQVLMDGEAQLRERFGAIFNEFPEVRAEVLSELRVGEYVVVEEFFTGRRADDRAIVIYRVVDNKIVHERMLR